MYDLLNIFEVFLPQLLQYPNPQDPLNSEAAKLLMSSESDYKKKVQDYIQKFAKSNESSAEDDKNKKGKDKSKQLGNPETKNKRSDEKNVNTSNLDDQCQVH